MATILFWAATLLLLHTYFFYPLVLVAWDALSGGTLPRLEQASPQRRSPIELSRNGDTLGGQERQAELKKQKVFLTGSLAGWEVGLQRTQKGQLEIWFGRLLLGHLDPQEVDFLRSEEAS